MDRTDRNEDTSTLTESRQKAPTRKPRLNATERDLFEVGTTWAEVIYFIQCEDMVKIGTTTGLARRVYTIRTSSAYPVRLIGVMPGGALRERELHDKYAAWRVRGEWFKLTRALEAFIRVEGYWPLNGRFYDDRESRRATHG